MKDYSLRVLEQKYLRKDVSGNVIETLPEFYTRVSQGIGEAEEADEKRELITREVYDLLEDQKALFGGRTLVAAGIHPNDEFTKVNLTLLNCFVVGVQDSLTEIFQAVFRSAKTLAAGGGVGYNFSMIRPEGTPASNFDRVASGPVSFMEVFHAAASKINQGSRRGAQMGILEDWHPDIFKFIEAKHGEGAEEKLTTFNLSVGIHSALLEAYRAGKEWSLAFDQGTSTEIDAQELLLHIAKHAWSNGEPGVIYLDNANKYNPTPHLGKLSAVNPCVAEGTLIATGRGMVPIEEVTELDQVWVDHRLDPDHHGSLFPVSEVFDVGEKPLAELVTRYGYRLAATPDHEVYTDSGWLSLDRLRPGHRLCLLSRSVFGSGRLSDKDPWAAGFLAGMATQGAEFVGSRLHFYVNVGDAHMSTLVMESLISAFEVVPQCQMTRTDRGLMTRISVDDSRVVELFRQTIFPDRIGSEIWGCDVSTQTGFIAGLMLQRVSAMKGPQVLCRYMRLAKDAQLLLLNLGVVSNIKVVAVVPKGTRGKKNLDVTSPRLLSVAPIFAYQEACAELLSFPVDPFMLDYLENRPAESFSDTVQNVSSITSARVYDIKEETTHSYVAGGIVVHNCSEAVLYPGEACCLGSINLAAHISSGTVDTYKLSDTAATMTRALDNVIQTSYYPLQDIGDNSVRDTVFATRKLGLGIMGLHDALIAEGIPYDTEEGRQRAAAFQEIINETAREVSEQLAEERGCFPAFLPNPVIGDTPIRNASRTSIAPTGSIAMVCDVSSGCEPYYDWVFTKYYFDRTEEAYTVIPALETLAAQNAYWGRREEWQSLMDNPPTDAESMKTWRGGIEELVGPEVVSVIKGAKDIAPMDHLKMLAALQTHVDQAISKTVNCAHDTTVEQILELLVTADELGCKSFTCYRDGSRSLEVLSSGVAAVDAEIKLVHDLTTVERPKGIPAWSSFLRSPAGTLNGTITIHPEYNRPFEMFLAVGKSGTDITAHTEAMARLISLLLKKGATLEEIASQLIGIGGSQPVGFGSDRVLSLPDGIAQIILEFLDSRGESVEVDESQAIGELCPMCRNNSIVRSGTCTMCRNCFYTTCG